MVKTQLNMQLNGKVPDASFLESTFHLYVQYLLCIGIGIYVKVKLISGPA